MADGDHPRLIPARPDLAAAHLEGSIDATRFATATRQQITCAVAPLLRVPDGDASLDTQLLFGELFDVYEIRPDGWVWGQSVLDRYVGYLPPGCLSDPVASATHRVVTLHAQTYAAPTLKLPPKTTLGLGALVAVSTVEAGYAQVATGGWIAEDHLRPLDQTGPDWVSVAERFVGVPYVWGGRSSQGLDCSALIQLARQAAGFDCPRDSDMQEAALGETLPPGTPPRRGDLVFWTGHVGVMVDAETLLHSTAHTMQTLREPLAQAVARIVRAEFGAVTRHARLDPAR